MSSNREFLKLLKAEKAEFFLCDFHVHSPASFDLREGARFNDLSEKEKSHLSKVVANKDLSAYESQVLEHFPVDEYYQLLLERKNSSSEQMSDNSWAFIAITDHNVCKYATELSKFAWEAKSENQLIILPGIELEVEFSIPGTNQNPNVHLLCIFSPCTSDSDIRLAIVGASGSQAWNFGQAITISDLPDFVYKLRSHATYPSITIAAHINTSKGVREEIKRCMISSLDATIARHEGEIKKGDKSDLENLEKTIEELKRKRSDKDLLSLEILEIIGDCGFDALQVGSPEDHHHFSRLHRYKADYGRGVPIICSDAHNIKNIFSVGEYTPYLKLSGVSSRMQPKKLFDEIQKHGLRYGETRFKYTHTNQVALWIEGIEVTPEGQDSARFFPYTAHYAPVVESFVLPLSRNLNCLIGGRGSGKSATIEAIGFFAEHDKYSQKGSANEDWYKRAKSTLQGCKLRLAGKIIKKNGSLQKNAIFIDAYFDSNGKHTPLKVSNIEGQEIPSSVLGEFPIEVFRVHDIEKSAQPHELQELFDRICGEKVANFNKEIISIKKRLTDQRGELVGIAKSISDLCKDKSPLREYPIRLREYNEINKPEIRVFFNEIDAAANAENYSRKLAEEWKKIISFNVEEKVKFVELTRANLKEKLRSLKDGTKEYETYKPLFDLLSKTGDGENDLFDVLILQLFQADKSVNAIQGGFESALEIIVYSHKKVKDELSAKGFPPGGKAREAKKVAFEEAERDLNYYTQLMVTWDKQIAERGEIFSKLEAICSDRTRIRKETAQRITNTLRTALDPSVLVISADAREMANKEEFIEWLEENTGHVFKKNRSDRVKALVEKEIMPKQLRNHFLGVEKMSPSKLIVDKEYANQGKVTDEDAKGLLNSGAVFTLSKDYDPIEYPPELVDTLPHQVKDGLVSFNLEEKTSFIIDEVLRLDEIIFDDLPVLKLNDRPTESASIERPISELSPGQRCSAILPILLINGKGPLIIDQPEENLDNRLIRQVIINILSTIKLERQVIIATHNPNMPVLGDAEQTIVLKAIGEKACSVEAKGDIDQKMIAQYITDIMEGGREAFQYRHVIYQQHWEKRSIEPG